MRKTYFFYFLICILYLYLYLTHPRQFNALQDMYATLLETLSLRQRPRILENHEKNRWNNSFFSNNAFWQKRYQRTVLSELQLSTNYFTEHRREMIKTYAIKTVGYTAGGAGVWRKTHSYLKLTRKRRKISYHT